jgi:hypothetical protein
MIINTKRLKRWKNMLLSSINTLAIRDSNLPNPGVVFWKQYSICTPILMWRNCMTKFGLRPMPFLWQPFIGLFPYYWMQGLFNMPYVVKAENAMNIFLVIRNTFIGCAEIVVP